MTGASLVVGGRVMKRKKQEHRPNALAVYLSCKREDKAGPVWFGAGYSVLAVLRTSFGAG